jgi:hypothetical protein
VEKVAVIAEELLQLVQRATAIHRIVERRAFEIERGGSHVPTSVFLANHVRGRNAGRMTILRIDTPGVFISTRK